MATPDLHRSDNSRFTTTRWSMVLAAGHTSSPDSRAALASLCETYWYPLYAFVRRQGYSVVESQDLTQGFFTRLLEKNDLGNVRRERGRFRAFLLASLRHYLLNQWDRATAAKRGGGRRVLSIDLEAAESRYRLEPADNRTAEMLYQRQWAMTLLDRVRGNLRAEFDKDGKSALFKCLEVHLTGERSAATYAETAKKLDMTEAAFKMAVSRLRKRFHRQLREEVAQTVATEAEIDDEIRAMMSSLRC